MFFRYRLKTLLVVPLAALFAIGLFVAPATAASAVSSEMQAKAHAKALGTSALATVLLADGNTFDHNAKDYDVVTEAVLAVLGAKPNSPVKVLTDGATPVTAFLPNDQAFRLLVEDITDEWIHDESEVFDAVASLGVDNVEGLLLYHVVPGATIDSDAAKNADNAVLTSALNKSFTVDVGKKNCVTTVRLVDLDEDERNPRVRVFDINRGNVQIAHGIDSVLRPMDI